ncbi:hypothetical protein J4771_00985 [Candidatus Kaistella beijingensis]|uniref:hypothetical protein n=1 Tax=Candidatus Kaistella beijingensis TaxID=2820270 RepID=UPI001CC3DE5B|nr:hypothetical protein [Candidatus Kaistella beijingensis]UBB89957.1 hypothetical protein J4771_00985 [Candidatus Kaistella beijingensis]
MKKILFLSIILFLANNAQAQLTEYKVRVEIDNSLQNVYDAAYYKASANYYKKENADMIKNHADRYFTALNRIVDFINDKKINSNEVELEINRLKDYGENILKLLPKLENDEVTGSNAQYTIEKANEELQYSTGNPNGNLLKIIKKNIMIQQFTNLTNEELVLFISRETGKSKENILSSCQYSISGVHDCLVMTLVNIKM